VNLLGFLRIRLGCLLWQGNPTFFHVAPLPWRETGFRSGPVTALVLFYPLRIACYRAQSSAVVGKLSKMDDASERIKFTDFITNVFTSPTDKVYETHHSATEPDSLEKTVKQIKPILDPILNLLSKNKS